MPLVSSALRIVRARRTTLRACARGWSRAALWGPAVALGIMPWALGAQVIPLKVGVVLTYATQPVDSTQRFDFEREVSIMSLTPDEMHLADLATNVLKPSNKTVSVTSTAQCRIARRRLPARFGWGTIVPTPISTGGRRGWPRQRPS